MEATRARRSHRLHLLVLMTLTAVIGSGGCSSTESGSLGVLDGLARGQHGRSMRATSAMRVGEIRRGPGGERNSGERRYDPTADFRGDADVQSNWDNFNVPPGGTHVLLDAKGPGVITHIWVTFLGPEPQGWASEGSADHQELMLRIFWDGNPRPAVEAPVGDFFANCFGRRSAVVSVPIVVEGGDSYNAFWRMPFRKSARIEIENQSKKPLSLLYYNIDWIALDALPADTPYFYAQYRQEYPVQSGRDYVLLETTGKGHYVGTVLGARMRSPAWFGEGDEKIYLDGETKPSIWGTGTEDYFLSAWGLAQTSTPYFGVPYYDQTTIDGHTSAYRWHLSDPIVFNTGIKVTLEHMGWIAQDENPAYQSTSWNEREDDYASVAFWYQTGEPTFGERAPGAEARRLPSLARVSARASALADRLRHGAGDVQTRATVDGGIDGHQVLVYRPAREIGGWLELPIEVGAKEPLRLSISGERRPDGGRYQAFLNGTAVGPVLDFYAEEREAREFPLLDFWPDPGTYTVKLEAVGRNGRSSGSSCSIEAVRLLERRPRVTQYGHDKDKDWRKAPMLYR